MDGAGKNLYWFSEEDLLLEVPFFQRPYVWDEENWMSLIESIELADEKTLPFLGSFILQEQGNDVYWVIDGQQRITTLSIFIKAYLDVTEESKLLKKNESLRTKLKDMIYREESLDCDKSEYKVRLIPSNSDREAFNKVTSFNKNLDTLQAGESNIVDCYLYFKKYISALDENQLRSLTNKLITKSKYVIAIILDSKDDEQAIFDTVNSLGKRLTNSDIVKNYLYQKMKSFADRDEYQIKKVLEHYDTNWKKVFIDSDNRDFWDDKISLGRMTSTYLDAFLKDFATLKGIYVPSESGGVEGLSKGYKKYIDKLSEDELKEFSEELSSYAKIYHDIWRDYKNCNDFKMSDRLNTTLLILDKLDTTTFNPYILKLVKNNDPEIDSKLFSLQKFLLQRYLWKATKKSYNKCCLELLKDDNPDQYFKKYNENTYFVDWNGYPLQIKNIPNKQATLLLFLVELIRRNKDGEKNFGDCLIYNKSLEHIMPKKWEEHWSSVPCKRKNSDGTINVLNDDDKEKYRKNMICSLGNMTLLNAELNSKISNEEFSIKIKGDSNKKGIEQFVRAISVAEEVVKQYESDKNWDEIVISERELKLANELNDYYHFIDKINESL